MADPRENFHGLPGADKKGKTGGIMDNDFILLDDLVYAPLHALEVEYGLEKDYE